MSRKLEDLTPSLQAAFLLAKTAFEKNSPFGYKVQPGDTYRDYSEQRRLYDQGRTTPGKIVTDAKPLYSKHNVYPSHAIDVLIFDRSGNYITVAEPYLEFGVILTGLSPFVRWGRFFHRQDISHFEI